MKKSCNQTNPPPSFALTRFHRSTERGFGSKPSMEMAVEETRSKPSAEPRADTAAGGGRRSSRRAL